MYKEEKLLKLFRDRVGVMRFNKIINEGFHRSHIKSLFDKGYIERIGRGLYKLKEYEPDNNISIVYAALQARKGVVCLLSALSYYNLTDIMPEAVDLAIPEGTKAYKIANPEINFHYYSKETWESGIDEHSESGQKFKIYNVGKTIADCFKFGHKIERSVAISAMKEALKEKMTTVNEILKYSRICRVEKMVRPILETIYS